MVKSILFCFKCQTYFKSSVSFEYFSVQGKRFNMITVPFFKCTQSYTYMYCFVSFMLLDSYDSYDMIVY